MNSSSKPSAAQTKSSDREASADSEWEAASSSGPKPRRGLLPVHHPNREFLSL